MDGLSAAASAIAVIQLCGSIFDVCRKYYTGVKDARKDITRLRNEVTRLESVLNGIVDLEDEAEDDSEKLAVLKTLTKPDGAISQCGNDLAGILEKLQGGQTSDEMRRVGWRALTWPLKSKDVDKAIADIERYKSLFILALTTDAATLNITLSKTLKSVSAKLDANTLEVGASKQRIMAVHDDVKEIRDQVKSDRKKKLLKDITTWLTYTDREASHQTARRKRMTGTGTWFLNSSSFRDWLSRRHSFMWIKGIPGCGKTVLTSTIIEYLQERCGNNSRQLLSYFYIEFADTSKQSPQNCLASILAQLCSGAQDVPHQLEALYERCGMGRSAPSVHDMIAILNVFACSEATSRIYIVIDALDECPKDVAGDQRRLELLEAVKSIREISPSNIHFLVTSRPEFDIEEFLTPLLSTPAISLHDSGVSGDVHAYIESQLQSDPKLNPWPDDIKSEIEFVLGNGANGMFRWVFCQLDALKRCKKRSSILLALKQLPKTLDETYERMLLAIDEAYKTEARRALLWLSFSERPLSVEEVAEASCIDLDAECALNPDDRFQDPRNNVLEILGSLVNIIYGNKIRLAHFSVKEYLVSTRSRAGRASDFWVSESDAHLMCTRSCLAYILHKSETPFEICELPFIEYACTYWASHARQLPEDDENIRPFATEFYGSCQTYENWRSMLRFNTGFFSTHQIGFDQKPMNPICHASSVGFASVVEELAMRSEMSHFVAVYPNEYPRRWSPLHIATVCRRSKTIAALLRINPQFLNAQTPTGHTALYMASEAGFFDIVSLLLDHGATINVGDVTWGSAVSISAQHNYLDIVQLLLSHSTMSEDFSRHIDHALLTCIPGGNTTVMGALIEHGANMEVKNSERRTPLSLAATLDMNPVTRFLLQRGANPNSADHVKNTPLHRAVQNSNMSAVQLLLDYKADITMRDSDGKTPFHYACAGACPQLVELFLQHRVGLMQVDGWGKVAIHYAAWAPDKRIMQQLLDSGAQLEVTTPQGETPLILAVQRGVAMVVECLLENGANVAACDTRGRTALHFAAGRGNGPILEALLHHGADPRVTDIRGLKPAKHIGAYDGEERNKIKRIG